MAFPDYDPYAIRTTNVDRVSGTAILLTSQDEMERLLGEDGINLFTDDADATGDNVFDNVIEEIIARVSAKILEHLTPMYDSNELEYNVRIREIATYWACHDLSRRRGNNPLYEAEVAENMEALYDYRLNIRNLDSPRSNPGISLGTPVVDARFPGRTIRTNALNSVNADKSDRGFFLYPFFWA